MLLAGIARRTRSKAFTRAMALALAGLLGANWVGSVIYQYTRPDFTPLRILPMQLCDWAAFTVMVALAFRLKGFYEVSYFWGLSGTFQAVLTPNLAVRFPDYRFISFFIVHSGIVAGVLFMTLAMGFRPTWGSVLRAMGWSQVYLAAGLLANWLTGANFGYLSHKPKVASLLDFLPANWYLYLLGLEMLAAVFYLGLYAPYAVADLIRARLPER